MVIRGTVEKKKKGKKRKKKLRIAMEVEMGEGEGQPSITSLFTDFSTGAMWIFVITEPKLPRSVFIRDSNDDF